MYLKDQTKRVQYTFRIKEDLMEDLKAYANAKGMKIPRILNEIIEEYLDGIVVNNTWLVDQPGTFITIPNEIPNKSIKVNDIDIDGMQYEVKAISNNLDVWDDKNGYMAKRDNINHEGIEPLLISDLAKDIELTNSIETIKELNKCLCAVYFRLFQDNELEILLMPIRTAIPLAAGTNRELANILASYQNRTEQLITNTINMLDDGNQLIIRKQLLDDLEELAQRINTGNIVPIGRKNHSKHIVWDNDAVLFGVQDNRIIATNSVQEMQKRIDELEKENKLFKERIDAIDNILKQTGVGDIINKFEKGNITEYKRNLAKNEKKSIEKEAN